MNGFAVSIVPSLISAGAGLFGVGVGVGIFRGTVRRFKQYLEDVQRKQRKLRGEDNGSIPLYTARNECVILRLKCDKEKT